MFLINDTTAIKFCLACLFCIAITLLPDIAFAAGADTVMGDVICTVTEWFQGNIGKGIATISLLIVGVLALFGKVSWQMAILDAVGVAGLFSAAAIVDAMNAGAPGNCATT